MDQPIQMSIFLKLLGAIANFFPYTIESIPVHRMHPKFPWHPDFNVAAAVSILREVNGKNAS